MPTLQIAYHPDELLFIARGQGPFTWAYGGHRAKPADFTSAELLGFVPGDKSGANLGTGVLGAQELRGGETARIKPPPPVPSPLPNILLWTLLIGGVGLLLIFVRNLAKESKAAGDGDSSPKS